MSAAIEITRPGVYDIPFDAYQADPIPGGSLSSSGARKLLPPSCPALFRWWADNAQKDTTRDMDLGTAAHLEVLGVGADVVVVEGSGKDPNAWRTNDDKAAVQAARDAGKTPITPRDARVVADMANALRADPNASRLLDPAHGDPEQTLVWFDAEFGVWRRALLDYLPRPSRQRRLIIPDYKTTKSAAPDDIAKSIHNFGYHQQAEWYLAGAEALGLPSDGPPAFVLIFQETSAPYLVTVVELDRSALEIARTRNRKALDIFRQCTASGVWPGYSDDVVSVGLPTWAEYQHADAEAAGLFDIQESA